MDQSQIIVMGREAYAVDWIAAACITILLYDHVITFGQEVENMWTLKLSAPKFLFFLNRYVVVSILVFNGIASSRTHLSNPFCVFFLRWLVVTITVTNTIVEGILVARVYALYRDDRVAVMLALSLYIGGIAVLVGLTIKDYVGTGPVEAVDDFAALPGCYARTVPSIIAGYWISPLIIESIFFLMVTWRAFGWWRSRAPVPPTMILLARDSSTYFLIIFVLLMANLLVFEFGPPFLSSMLVTPSNTAGCIAGSRMLLNIRGLRPNPELTTTDIEMSGIEFREQPRSTWGTGYKRKGMGNTTSFTSGGTTMTTEGTMGVLDTVVEEIRE